MTNPANAASREARVRGTIDRFVCTHWDAGAKRDLGSEILVALADEAASQPREGVEAAAINQNDSMRQELANVGNLVSDLAAAMRVDQANDDGSWPDLAGRMGKLITRARLNDTAPTDQAQGGGTPEPAHQDNAEIVERVARAIYEAFDDRTGWPWDRSILGGKEFWLKQARAAIRALATPIQGEI